MTDRWRDASLATLLRPVTRPEPVQSDREYRLLGAHWYAKGLYTKEVKRGSAIRARALYRVCEGDFVYNRLFAWMGSFALASAADDGQHVSNEFLCFEVDRTQVAPEYLWYYFSRPAVWREALGLSTGTTTTSRNRLKQENFLGLTMALPPVTEQARIVRHLSRIATQVEAATELRRLSSRYVAALVGAVAERAVVGEVAERLTLGQAISSHDSGWSPKCEERAAGAGEWGVLKTTSVQWGGFDWEQNKALRPGQAPRPRLEVREGDVLITRAGPTNRVGVACMVGESPQNLMLSDKIVRVRTGPRVLAEYLPIALARTASQEYLHQGKTGLAASQVNVSREKLLNLPLAVPSLDAQARVVERVRVVQAAVSQVQQLEAQSSAQLAALMQSILDRVLMTGE
jgi:type I restriction enzyme S subunit